MKMKNKAFILALSMVLLAAVSVLGTMAYFTDSEAVTNTFTVGSVKINLDESAVKPDGTVIQDVDRVTENDYELLPGRAYVKDPTVTVKGGSSDAYVRMMVTVNYSSQLDAIFAQGGLDLMSIFVGYDSAKWILHDVTEDVAANTRTYEFRYKEVVAASDSDTPLGSLFTGFTVPGGITSEQLASLVTKDAAGKITDQFKIMVEAHAIQAAGFEGDEAGAWAAFDVQHPQNS